MSVDCVLSDIGDMVGSLGFSFGKSIKSVADKAKTGAAMTPQGQMVQAATSATSKGGTIPTSSKSSGIMSKFGGAGSKAGGMLSSFTKKKLYGIPVLFVAGGIGAFVFFKFGRKRR